MMCDYGRLHSPKRYPVNILLLYPLCIFGFSRRSLLRCCHVHMAYFLAETCRLNRIILHSFSNVVI